MNTYTLLRFSLSRHDNIFLFFFLSDTVLNIAVIMSDWLNKVHGGGSLHGVTWHTMSFKSVFLCLLHSETIVEARLCVTFDSYQVTALLILLSSVNAAHCLTGCEVVPRHCVMLLVWYGTDLSYHSWSHCVDVLRQQTSTECSRKKQKDCCLYFIFIFFLPNFSAVKSSV